MRIPRLLLAMALMASLLATARAQQTRPAPTARWEDGQQYIPPEERAEWDRDRDSDPFADERDQRHRPDYDVPLQVSAWSNSSRYRFGEAVRMAVRVNRDSWIWILSEDDSRQVKLLYPNYHERSPYVTGGRILWLPSRNWEMPAGPPAGLRRITILSLDARAMEPRRLRYQWSREAPFPFVERPDLLVDDILQSARDARRSQSRGGSNLFQWVFPPDDPAYWWSQNSTPPNAQSDPQGNWGDEHFFARTDLFIRVIADGHGNAGDWDDLRPGPVPPPTTDPNAARLRVATTPSNAEVYLNGRFHGYTPLETPLNPRQYELVVKRRNYRPFVQEVQLERRRTQRLSIRLERE